jgi:hypothetical protein
VAFEVNDLRAAVDWAATEGYGLVGGIGEYEGAWRMAYVPEWGRSLKIRMPRYLFIHACFCG